MIIKDKHISEKQWDLLQRAVNISDVVLIIYFFFCRNYLTGSSPLFRLSGIVILMVTAITPYIFFVIAILYGKQSILVFLGIDIHGISKKDQSKIIGWRGFYIFILFYFIADSRAPINYAFVLPVAFFFVYSVSLSIIRAKSVCIYLIDLIENTGISKTETNGIEVLEKSLEKSEQDDPVCMLLIIISFFTVIFFLITNFNVFYSQKSIIPYIFYSIISCLCLALSSFFVKQMLRNNIMSCTIVHAHSASDTTPFFAADSKIKTLKTSLVAQYRYVKTASILFLLIFCIIFKFLLRVCV
jgi:hypothetical protein